MCNYIIYNHYTQEASVYTAHNEQELWGLVLQDDEEKDYFYDGYLEVVAVFDLDTEEDEES